MGQSVTESVPIASIESGIEVSTTQNNIPITEGTVDLDITVNRKEYSIVGDEVYIPKLYEDAPQWMKELVNLAVDISVASNNSDLISQMNVLIGNLAGSVVPLNTFTQSILALNTEDSRLNSVIETLNSNYSDSTSDINAQILDIKETYTRKDEASATAAATLEAHISDATTTLGSILGNLQTVVVEIDNARASDYTALESAIAGESDATATAIGLLTTDVQSNSDSITSAATDITQLGVDISNETTARVSGDTTVTNTLNAAIVDGDRTIESKWEYGSIVNINGVYKKAGFGLTTNYTTGTGTEVDPYVSEFWIDASKMKFTNSNVTGQVTPFTIDASGATPAITFNGNVEFSNITGYTAPDVSGDIRSAEEIFAASLGFTSYDAMVSASQLGSTIINGGYLNTTLIDAGAINAEQINTVGLVAEDVTATDFYGKNFYGGYFEGARINGAVISASYLDLDGELKVLTDFHISVSVYNASPSTYIDAVYIEADNEYRIPSVSTIRNVAGVATVLSTGIRPYNNANSGHNVKAVRIRPDLVISSSHRVFASNTYDPMAGTTYCYRLYLCGVEQCVIYRTKPTHIDSTFIYIVDSTNGSSSAWSKNINQPTSATGTVTKALACGLNVRVEVNYSYSSYSNNAGNLVVTRTANFSVYLDSSYVTLSSDFVSGDVFTAWASSGTGYSPASLISINNMI